MIHLLLVATAMAGHPLDAMMIRDRPLVAMAMPDLLRDVMATLGRPLVAMATSASQLVAMTMRDLLRDVMATPVSRLVVMMAADILGAATRVDRRGATRAKSPP